MARPKAQLCQHYMTAPVTSNATVGFPNSETDPFPAVTPIHQMINGARIFNCELASHASGLPRQADLVNKKSANSRD